MNIRDYIIGKEYQNTESILLTARGKLYQEAVQKIYNQSNQQIEKLQEFLQEKFYGTESNDQESRRFYQEVLQMYENQTNQIVMGHDWGSEARVINQNDNKVPKKGEIEHKAQIYVATLRTRLQQLEEYYNKVKDIKSLQEFSNEVKKAINEIKKIINSTAENRVQIRFTKESKMYQMIQHIDLIYAEFLRKTNITLFDYGSILEYGVAVLDAKLDQKKKKITYDIIKDNLGKKQVNRQGTNLDMVFDLSEFRDNIEEIKDSSIQIGGLKIKTDFTGATSAKADVILNIPAYEDMPFKISLKNWADIYDSGSRYGFGETSIMGAIARANPSKTVLEHYLYALGPLKANKGQIEAMHKYSKMSLAIDIISGYSMRAEGRNADTVVINNRGERKIYVYSIKQLIDEAIKENSFLFSYFNYNEGIKIYAEHFLWDLSRWNTRQSNLYKAQMIKLLSGIRVRLLLHGAL